MSAPGWKKGQGWRTFPCCPICGGMGAGMCSSSGSFECGNLKCRAPLRYKIIERTAESETLALDEFEVCPEGEE